MKKTVPLYKASQSRLDTLGRVLRENLTGVRVIRAFARHEKEQERMNEATDNLSKAYIRVSNLSALMNPITSLVMNIGIIVLLYIGAINVNIGTLTQGDIVVLINYITQVLLALIIVADLVVLFTKASASAARINEIFEYTPSIVDNKNEKVLEYTDKIVVFDNVYFKYNSEEVLSNLSFTIEKGNIFGIVGTTGSGKSTVANLIPRFYDATEGRVIFGGKDVKDLSQSFLHDEVGVVPQKAVLFSGTIADNIRWGKEEATDEEVIEALQVAQAYDFVSSMKDGINSVIYEGGKNLSGGQRQRLTIARALIKKPNLIILDDSLSALDYQTDKKLRNSLKENLKNSTVIIISQRISSIISGDKILVLDDGRCVGLGNHEELLSSCETYKEIYESQSR